MKKTFRKLPQFSDVLERRYQLKHKQTPFEVYTMLRSRGATRDEACDFIQEQMDDIWKEYRAEKQEEARQRMFHPVTDTENPFNFTETENDLLEHIYRTQEEQPLSIPPEYDIHGDQMELSLV